MSKEVVGKAIANRVKNGDIIGAGVGSTVNAALNALSKRIRAENLQVQLIPASEATAEQCIDLGITILNKNTPDSIPWTFDGADALDKNLQALKGGGGAMYEEKILARKSREYILIVDETKFVENIFTRAPVPVEVTPEAIDAIQQKLKDLGAIETIRRSVKTQKTPWITPRGNYILDAKFLETSQQLESSINNIPGVVENGLFLNYATEALVGSPDGTVRTIKK